MAETESLPANLNKMSLANAVALRMGLARTVAYEAVENVFDIIAQHVAQGGSVSVTNFGGWSRPEKKARQARNPHTGDTIQVPERKGIKFSPAPRWVNFANSDDPSCATIRKNIKGLSGN